MSIERFEPGGRWKNRHTNKIHVIIRIESVEGGKRGSDGKPHAARVVVLDSGDRWEMGQFLDNHEGA